MNSKAFSYEDRSLPKVGEPATEASLLLSVVGSSIELRRVEAHHACTELVLLLLLLLSVHHPVRVLLRAAKTSHWVGIEASIRLHIECVRLTTETTWHLSESSLRSVLLRKPAEATHCVSTLRLSP